MLEKSAARLSPADGCWMSTPQPRPAQLPAICQTTPYPTDTPTPSRNINPRCIHHQKRWYLFPELRDLSPGRTNILRLNLVCFSPCVFYPFSYPHFFFPSSFLFLERDTLCVVCLYFVAFLSISFLDGCCFSWGRVPIAVCVINSKEATVNRPERWSLGDGEAGPAPVVIRDQSGWYPSPLLKENV